MPSDPLGRTSTALALALCAATCGAAPPVRAAAPRLSPASSLLERLDAPRLTPPEVAQRTDVVRLRKFLSDGEIDAMHAAASRVRAEVGEVQRSNGLEAGSWRTVFFNHRLREELPALHAKLMAAARAVDADHWGLLDAQREELAIRVAEYHTIVRSGGLPIDKHHDFGSLITMDLLLSGADDFEGGTFATMEADGELRARPFERGDLLLFQSHKYHRVSPVTRGTRQVFVCELWEGLERRCPARCQTAWGPCYCRLDSVYYRERLPDGRAARCELTESRET